MPAAAPRDWYDAVKFAASQAKVRVVVEVLVVVVVVVVFAACERVVTKYTTAAPSITQSAMRTTTNFFTAENLRD